MSHPGCSIQELVAILKQALERPDQRSTLISEFQNRVWNCESSIAEERIDDNIHTLAFDLDYYEPNDVLRSEDSAYFDDSKVEDLIRDAIQSIDQVLRESASDG